MPFTLTWTENTGSKSITVETAEGAFQQAIFHQTHVKLVIKDDHGRRLTTDDLIALLPERK